VALCGLLASLLHYAAPKETAAPPGRADLMAALRASVEIGTVNEAAPLPEDTRRKRRSRERPPTTSPQPSVPPQPEVSPVNNAVLWHVDKTAFSPKRMDPSCCSG
jgi:hypothetical protein